MRYDLIILGRDPAGLDGALAAVQLGKRVAIVSPPAVDEVPTFAALREAALMLTGFRHRNVSSDRFARRREVSVEQLRQLSREVDSRREANFKKQLQEQGVDFLTGSVCFLGPNEVEVTTTDDQSRYLTGDRILLAVGTRSVRPNGIPFDGETVFDLDEALSLDRVPKSMIVIGSGPVALEYAMTFALLGTRVAVVDEDRQLLEFCDREMVHLLRQHATKLGVHFRFGRAVNAIERTFDHRAVVRLAGGKNLIAECVLYAASRRGRTDALNLAAAGLQPDEHGRLWCNEYGQTWAKHVYGVGEVVGFPVFAYLTMGQGPRAVQHAFGHSIRDTLPVSRRIRTTPELAMVGATEQQLRHDLVAYEVGVTRFRDVSRGHAVGASGGMLKLLFHRESLELLGVHCLGESASKLIRLGQTVMSMGGSIELFRDECLSDSPLSDSYRLAAKDGMRRVEEATAISESRLRIWRPRSRRRRWLVPSHR